LSPVQGKEKVIEGDKDRNKGIDQHLISQAWMTSLSFLHLAFSSDGLETTSSSFSRRREEGQAGNWLQATKLHSHH
jgi:hypothetical protein